MTHSSSSFVGGFRGGLWGLGDDGIWQGGGIYLYDALACIGVVLVSE